MRTFMECWKRCKSAAFSKKGPSTRALIGDSPFQRRPSTPIVIRQVSLGAHARTKLRSVPVGSAQAPRNCLQRFAAPERVGDAFAALKLELCLDAIVAGCIQPLLGPGLACEL